MKIAHVAIWTSDLERSRRFYETYFRGQSNNKYVNEKKGFSSYFLFFEGSASLEIMQCNDIFENREEKEMIGLAHIAFRVWSRKIVDKMIETLREDGYRILGEPRLTGDGYYEGIVADPDGNRIEIVV
jgi:lactoylglutathione lyase